MHKSSTKVIVFHYNTWLKVNLKCGFTQYNGPNTYRSTYILVWSELQSTLFLYYCEIQVCTQQNIYLEYTVHWPWNIRVSEILNFEILH